MSAERRRGTTATADSQVAWLAVGSGDPVTLFAHGLGSSIAETRMLVPALPGTQVFLSFRGHAETTESADARWGYDGVADDLVAVARETGATRCMGISLGAAALLRALLDGVAFERAVFFTPAVLEEPRSDAGMSRVRRMGDLVAARDVDALEALLLAEMPEVVRSDERARAYMRTRATNLAGLRIQHLVDALSGSAVVDDLVGLAGITSPCLVVTQAGDEVHPAAVGARLAAAIPGCRLEEFGVGGAMWADLPRLHQVLTDFLG